MSSAWKNYTKEFTGELREAILQLHHASQFIGMVGSSYQDKQSDDSHTNLIWEEPQLISSSNHLRAVLNLNTWTWELENRTTGVTQKLNISQNNKIQALHWFQHSLEQFGVDASKYLPIPKFELPYYPLLQHHSFSDFSPNTRATLISFFTNAHQVLNQVKKHFVDAAPIRVWPHHFDMGSLIPVQPTTTGETNKSIGFGWAIPDDHLLEPYFYINYYNVNKKEPSIKMPKLQSDGQWHCKAWTGIVFPYSKILLLNDQFSALESYFLEGIRTIKSQVI